jgi:hypothetical protein
MQVLYNKIRGLVLTGLILAALASTASAQRGSHYGGVHVTGGISLGGFHGGIGIHGGVSYAYRGPYGYGYYGYPVTGFRVGYLPYPYYPFYFGADLYYYYGGVFYMPNDNGGYEVTIPPIGAAVPELPQGAQPILIDGKQYYEYNGVYYQPTVNDKGKTVYIIAGKDGQLNTNGDVSDDAQPAPQVGDVVNQLPDNCRIVNLNGKKYYVSPDGIYYEDFTDKNNAKGYRIVSIPIDGEQQN